MNLAFFPKTYNKYIGSFCVCISESEVISSISNVQGPYCY